MDSSKINQALEIIGPLDYTEGPDYATITSPAFQMMTVQPHAVLTLLEMWPTALFEINTLKLLLEQASKEVSDLNLLSAINEVLK